MPLWRMSTITRLVFHGCVMSLLIGAPASFTQTPRTSTMMGFRMPWTAVWRCLILTKQTPMRMAWAMPAT